MKICTMCELSLPLDSFYSSPRKDRPNGKQFKISSHCKKCSNIKSRERYARGVRYAETRLLYSASEKGRECLERANRKHYESISGRASHLLNNAKKRTHKWSDFDIDRQFIEEKLRKGVCEVTGLPFDFTSPGQSRKNPFAPSIDRIDNNIGYIKSNVRLVLWAVNLMHGEMTDEQLVNMCKAVIKGLEK